MRDILYNVMNCNRIKRFGLEMYAGLLCHVLKDLDDEVVDKFFYLLDDGEIWVVRDYIKSTDGLKEHAPFLFSVLVEYRMPEFIRCCDVNMYIMFFSNNIFANSSIARNYNENIPYMIEYGYRPKPLKNVSIKINTLSLDYRHVHAYCFEDFVGVTNTSRYAYSIDTEVFDIIEFMESDIIADLNKYQYRDAPEEFRMMVSAHKDILCTEDNMICLYDVGIHKVGGVLVICYIRPIFHSDKTLKENREIKMVSIC